MGIFSRFNRVLKSNLNSLLDRAEDPEKLINQTVVEMQKELKRAKSFAVQGQLITAIGTIGDHTAIDPLIDILDNTSRPAAARAMAAVGLGMIGDLLPLSKLSRLSENYNYRASVEDLDELLFIL